MASSASSRITTDELLAHWREMKEPAPEKESTLSKLQKHKAFPWAVIGCTFLEFLFLSIFRLPVQFGVSVANPLGLLTANLVFDDWWNLLILGFAVCTIMLSAVHMANVPRAMLPTAFFAAANMSGMLASLVWLISPFARSYYDMAKGVIVLPVAVGMSASVFGAASFALVFGIFVQLRLYRRYGKSAYTRSQLFWALLYFSTVSCVFISTSVFYAPAIDLSHVAGIASGSSIAYWATRTIDRRSRASGTPLVLTR